MKAAFRFAVPRTLPILAGYFFLGGSFGILLTSFGLHPLLAIIMSMIVFAGSAQFLAVQLLTAPFNPLAAFMIIFMLNARHIFYSLALLEPINHLKFARNYIRFALTDETFSIIASTHRPATIDRNWFYFHTAWLNQLYWILGTSIGAFAGTHLTVNTTGIEFVLVALFLILFLENFLTAESNQQIPAFIGFGGSILSLWVFGPDHFIIPAMILMLIAFKILYDRKERDFA